MSYYTYKIKDKHGRMLTGKIEAPSYDQASLTLREKGFFVVQINDIAGDLTTKLNVTLDRIQFADVVNFTRQLATMIDAGLSLTNSLSILIEQSKAGLGVVLSKVLSDVESGSALNKALSKHPKVFSKTYVQLVRAGEMSGTLDKVLIRLADNMERERQFKAKIKGAMIYPAFIISTMIGAIIVVMVVVVPKLTDVFTEMDAKLPFATQILIFLSGATRNFWWLGLLMVMSGFIGFKVWMRDEKAKIIFDRFLFALPIVGILRKKIILAEFTRTLSLLLKAGINLVEALEIVTAGMSSAVFKQIFQIIRSKVEKGVSVGEAMSVHSDLPPLIYQMVTVGEQTGKLDMILYKVSDYYQQESERAIDNLMKSMEPIIMVVMGLGVAFLAFAILMPIYDLTSQMTK